MLTHLIAEIPAQKPHSSEIQDQHDFNTIARRDLTLTGRTGTERKHKEKDQYDLGKNPDFMMISFHRRSCLTRSIPISIK